jgi:HAD superfamily hydrolase (TIGR01490 family)
MAAGANPNVRLAIFDLDNTLLAGDSDYLWGRFLIEVGAVDPERYEAENLHFYEQYKAGTLDINAFSAFSLAPLAAADPAQLRAWRECFVEQRIVPVIARGTPALLERHRAQGDHLLITTATNRFVTEPIARLLGVDDIIATDPEVIDGRITGRLAGRANFQAGKVERLEAWLRARTETFEHLTAYSDSHNDLPLLRRADVAVAVDPDDVLRAEAQRCGWPVISLSDADLPTL